MANFGAAPFPVKKQRTLDSKYATEIPNAVNLSAGADTLRESAAALIEAAEAMEAGRANRCRILCLGALEAVADEAKTLERLLFEGWDEETIAANLKAEYGEES